MIWQEEMKRDAAKVAFPDFDLRDTDLVQLSTQWEPGWGGSYSFEPAAFRVTVTITRDGGLARNHTFENEAANRFFTALMRRASAKDVNALDVMIRIAKREAMRDPVVEAHFTEKLRTKFAALYENAMYYLSVSAEVRPRIHELVRQGQHGQPRNLRTGT